MENNKYYTPSTEELRVGLEYETLREMKGGTMVPKEEHIERWSKEVMDKWNLANILTSWPHIIRIKYLDTQDIEELGFKYIPDLSEGDGNVRWYDLYEKGNISLLHWDYSDKDNKVVIKRNNTIIFEGTILNKSELKWILTRVGVL